MAISLTVAKQLCTNAEQTLVTESLARNVKNLDKKALRSRISRSRKLRDKYRQLADRQDREARGKQSPQRSRPAQGSRATRKKQQLFAESLERFEKQLAVLSPEAESPASTRKAIQETAKKRFKKKSAKKSSASKAKSAATEKSVVKKATKKPGEKAPKKRSTATDRSNKATLAAKAREYRLKKSGRKRIETHLAAQGRRNQSRRDHR